MIASPYVQLATLALVIAVAFLGAVIIGPGLLGTSKDEDDETGPLDWTSGFLLCGARNRP
jgi:hypothetical protein